MTWKKLANTFGLALDALDIIAQLTKNTSDDKAADVLRAISKVLDTIKAGFDGKVTAKDCEAALADLRKHLVDHDAAADAKLAAKFPVKD